MADRNIKSIHSKKKKKEVFYHFLILSSSLFKKQKHLTKQQGRLSGSLPCSWGRMESIHHEDNSDHNGTAICTPETNWRTNHSDKFINEFVHDLNHCSIFFCLAASTLNLQPNCNSFPNSLGNQKNGLNTNSFSPWHSSRIEQTNCHWCVSQSVHSIQDELIRLRCELALYNHTGRTSLSATRPNKYAWSALRPRAFRHHVTPSRENYYPSCDQVGGVTRMTTTTTCTWLLRPNPHRTRDATQSKWDLLMWMGVSTLHASNIKGFAFEFGVRASCVDEAIRPSRLRRARPKNKSIFSRDADLHERRGRGALVVGQLHLGRVSVMSISVVQIRLVAWRRIGSVLLWVILLLVLLASCKWQEVLMSYFKESRATWTDTCTAKPYGWSRQRVSSAIYCGNKAAVGHLHLGDCTLGVVPHGIGWWQAYSGGRGGVKTCALHCDKAAWNSDVCAVGTGVQESLESVLTCKYLVWYVGYWPAYCGYWSTYCLYWPVHCPYWSTCCRY